ncbi:MAG: glutamate--tRNA ligase [Ruminococcaceae bacterium]|nr:glutamate--tRNA ligase [Oscillospiraceae bacterium]
MSKARTRFAPSPTGYMHIGNLRTALYAYLLTKNLGGDYILRIEDTDQERYVEGAVDLIYRTMKETGLKHDEGPDVGGDYGPYIQSERMGIYKEYAEKLVELGGAYYCFCGKERLEEMKEEQAKKGLVPKYDGHCRNLSKEEIQAKLDAGEPYVIRQKIDPRGTTTFEDAVFGSITVENSSLDENVLLKSDGLPTYNFANVVDDHLMKITHVIRGNEYLSSTPKYNLLYNSFGWEIPTYVHVSPIIKESGKKLSKREGDASYEDFTNKGYLKDAIINYIALLGWSPGGEQEIFTMDELIEHFSISGISKSPAVFDEKKLAWINGEYIRKLSMEEFEELAKPWFEKAIKKEVDYKKLAILMHDRTEKFIDIVEQLDFIDELPDYDIDLYNHKKMKTNPENSLESLKAALPVLEALNEWNEESIHNTLFELIEKLGVKNGLILWPVRVALSGKSFTPGGAIEIADLLGKEESIERIKKGIEKLS